MTTFPIFIMGVNCAFVGHTGCCDDRLCSFSTLRLNLVLTYEIPSELRGGVHLLHKTTIRHRVSPEFIGSRNCVPMASTAESPPTQGQYISRWFRTSAALLAGHHGPINMPLFPTPTIGIEWVCLKYRLGNPH